MLVRCQNWVILREARSLWGRGYRAHPQKNARKLACFSRNADKMLASSLPSWQDSRSTYCWMNLNPEGLRGDQEMLQVQVADPVDGVGFGRLILTWRGPVKRTRVLANL